MLVVVPETQETGSQAERALEVADEAPDAHPPGYPELRPLWVARGHDCCGGMGMPCSVNGLVDAEWQKCQFDSPGIKLRSGVM